MLSHSGDSQDNAMTDTVRDGLLYGAGNDIQLSANVKVNHVGVAGSLRRQMVALEKALGKQSRRRTSSFELMGMGMHVAPETRGVLESLSEAASIHPAPLVRAVRGAKDTRRLVAGLVAIVKDCDADSRVLAHCIDIAFVLFKDRSLRSMLIAFNAIDIVAAKLKSAHENQSLVFRFLEVATKHAVPASTTDIKALVAFLQNHILTSITPSLSVLPIIASICASRDLAVYLNSLPHSERFLRQILGYLSNPDINFLTVVHSLQILVRLTVEDPLGQKFFKDSNIDQIWNLVFSMLEKGSCYNLDPVLDLLEETIAIPKFRSSFEIYVSNATFVKQAMIQLHLNSSNHPLMFKFISILLNANLSVPKIAETILERDILPGAFRHLAVTVTSGGGAPAGSNPGAQGVPLANDCFPDGGDSLTYTLAFIRSVLSLVQDPSRISNEILRQLIIQFGLSIRILFRAICDAFKKPSSSETTSEHVADGRSKDADLAEEESLHLSAEAMIDVIGLCDAIISCPELRLRAENLVAVKLNPLIAFLALFSEDGKSSSFGAGVVGATAGTSENAVQTAKRVPDGWGGEMVVAVLHLVIVAVDIKKEEYPTDVIDSNNIKYIIADSLRTSTHPHVLSSCLNIVSQCPSKDYLVTVFEQLNTSKPQKSSYIPPPSKTDSSRTSENGNSSTIDHMSNSLADLEIDETPTPMAQMDEAERSIQVLTQLEKEVGNIADRMKKEMELKEAIAERKIAAHESKAQLLKSELLQLKELLDEKMVIIRQLEGAQSEAVRKNSDYSSLLAGNEAEIRRLKIDLESLKVPLKTAQERCELLEMDLHEKNRTITEKSQALDSTRSSLAQLTKQFEDKERTMESTTLQSEAQLSEYKERLVVKEELEMKLLAEAKSLRTQLKASTEEKDKLAAMVEKYQDEEAEHDDLVKRLAQLASIAKTKRGQ
ncbi:hypothetical protein BJ741DRAFT_607537 [Chytriomyces cf. hyalinus JEL632]|nr:hypothetical protein BJ741DRAFT_607537 [Chytriomyces cf. hyalinus JEL632]